jgi:hypothetical protein
MNITKFSRDRMMLTATRWSVPREYIEPLYNYLVYGFEPGSFWSAVLANDFMRAVQHSHPGNSIEALKSTVGWIRDNFPEEAYGDSDKVILWQDLESVQRRQILESKDMIYTEQEEIMLALTGTKTYEPIWTN